MLNIGRLFVRLGLAYGHLWSSQFKSEEMLQLAKREWAKTIGHHSAEKLDTALERCKKEYKKAPTLPEFMECLKVTPLQALTFDKPKGITHQESEEDKAKRIKKGERVVKGLIDGLGVKTEKRKPIKDLKQDYNEEEILAELGAKE